MKKKYLLLLALVAFGFVINSCTNSSKSLAPKHIKNYVISSYIEKAKDLDTPDANTTGYYEFKPEETYTFTLKGKIVEEGSYSYKRTSSNTSSILLSYSFNSEVYDYLIILHFSTPYSGKWNSSYNNDGLKSEYGTFKILRHGFK